MGPFQGFGPKWDQVPNLEHHYKHCSCCLVFFLFRDQTFRNRDRDFFPRPIFFETESETFFPKPNFPKPKPKPSKIWQKFRNREVSKPKCQSLVSSQVFHISDVILPGSGHGVQRLLSIDRTRGGHTRLSCAGDSKPTCRVVPTHPPTPTLEVDV